MPQKIATNSKKTHFNKSDWQLFFAMQNNPPQPSERLKKAAAMYQKIITASPDV